MKILYDYQMFTRQKYGGISKYFCELIRNISPEEHSCKLGLLFTDNNYLLENAGYFKKRGMPIPERKFKGRKFLRDRVTALNRWYSRKCIRSGQYDLLHPTFYDPYFLENLKRPFIVTVHDMIDFLYKDTLYRHKHERPNMETVIRHANRIIAISHNTKNDIVNILQVDPDKIDVVHHGYNLPATMAYSNPYGQYLLFVGRRETYKNFENFVRAAAPRLTGEKELKVICVGGPFLEWERELFKELKIEKQLIAINVSEDTLDQLYAHARVFVFPSLYEGFGMPVLEAFANQCPVCLSNTSSFPEVAGDAAIYFDPHSVDEMRAAIEKIMDQPAERERLVRAGTQRLNEFSWKKTADQTLVAYQRCLDSA